MAKRKQTNKKGQNKNTNTQTKSNNATKKSVNTNNKNTYKNVEQKQPEKTKIKNNEPEKKETESNEFKRLLKIILIVTAVFGIFYIVTILVTKTADDAKLKQKLENKTVEKAEIQYENIMIGTMLNHSGTYYVLIEAKKDNRLDEYESLIETIKAKEDSPNIYKANLTDSFNKVYLGKEENYYVSDISEFKVKTTTLIKVVDGKIDAALDNYDAIKKKLNELT